MTAGIIQYSQTYFYFYRIIFPQKGIYYENCRISGQFDPITQGHLDILKTGAEIFDKVIIAVARNSEKKGFLPVEERVKLIRESVKDIDNVEVDSFEGLTIEYAKKKGAKVLIRGLRAVSDFEYELQLSQANSAMWEDIKTVFLTTKPKYNFISSSTIKEIYLNDGDISKFVPDAVYNYLMEKKQWKQVMYTTILKTLKQPLIRDFLWGQAIM